MLVIKMQNKTFNDALKMFDFMSLAALFLHYLHTDPDFKESSKSANGTFQCF